MPDERRVPNFAALAPAAQESWDSMSKKDDAVDNGKYIPTYDVEELLSKIEAAKESLDYFIATDLRHEPAWQAVCDDEGKKDRYFQWWRGNDEGDPRRVAALKLSDKERKNFRQLDLVRAAYDLTVVELKERMPPLVSEAAKHDSLPFDAMLLMSEDGRNMTTDAAVRAKHQLNCLKKMRVTLGDGLPVDKTDHDDAVDWKPADWFTRNTKVRAPRLRQAAKAGRKTRRVRSKVIDGIKHYSAVDARRHWPDDMAEKP